MRLSDPTTEEIDAAVRSSRPILPRHPSPSPAPVEHSDSFQAPREEPGRNEFRLVPITELPPATEPNWLWPGYLVAGGITLLTGLWKAGKTTLLSHLLRDLQRGGGLVESPVEGSIVIVSEEPSGLWSMRREEMGLGPSVHLMERQSLARLDRGGWRRMLDMLRQEVAEGRVSLVIFDTLASVWPVGDENDASQMMEVLMPIRDLSSAGAAVLLVHHPRKSGGAEMTATRGSGALPGFVDVLIELRRFEPDNPKDTRRVLTATGRYPGIEPKRVLELTPGGYVWCGTPDDIQMEDQLETIARLLPKDSIGWTWEDILDAWMTEPRIGKTRLCGLLNQGYNEGRWHRSGRGVKGDPFRYWAKSAEKFDSATNFSSARTESNPEQIQLIPEPPSPRRPSAQLAGL